MRLMRGVNTPMVTPFDSEGKVDFDAMKAHVDFLISRGVSNLYPLGTLGEGVLMTLEERKKVAETVVEHTAGRVGVFIHVGAQRTDDAAALARHAQEIGADGVGAITPYFYRADQEDMYDYFAAISQAVSEDFPVYMYNLPGVTGNDLKPETVRDLSKRSNIVGIKNTMDSDLRISQLYRCCGEEFSLISGDDTNPLGGLALGAKGVVSGTSNVFPELFVELYKYVQENDLAQAARTQHRIYQFVDLMKNDYRPCYIKAMMEIRGLKKSFSRAPLKRCCTQEEMQYLRRGLSEIFDDAEIRI